MVGAPDGFLAVLCSRAPRADTPLTETILSVFSCREIDGVHYLVADIARECYTTDHMRYFRAGIFWAILYCIGIPAAYLAFLVSFHVPRIARKLVQRARLLALLDVAWAMGVQLPRSKLSVDSLSDELIDVLYIHYIAPLPPSASSRKPRRTASAAAVGGEATGAPQKRQSARSDSTKTRVKTPRVKAPSGTADEIAVDVEEKKRRPAKPRSGAPAAQDRTSPSRDEKLAALLRYAGTHLSTVHVPWSAAQDDPELAVAAQTIGGIFIEFYASSWYWILVSEGAPEHGSACSSLKMKCLRILSDPPSGTVSSYRPAVFV